MRDIVQVRTGDDRIADQSSDNMLLDNYSNMLQYELLKYNNSEWRIHEGVVTVSCPALGWSIVTVSGRKGQYVAQQTSCVNDWGARNVQPYPNDARVLAALNIKNDELIILGQLNHQETPEKQYTDYRYIGSWAGYVNDPHQKVLESVSDMGHVQVVHNGQPADQLSTDWSVQNSLGGMIYCEPLGIGILIDEVTYLKLDSLNQEVELSGRRLHLESDTFRITNQDCPKIGKLQLSGGLKYDQMPDINVQQFDAGSLKSTDNGFVYEIDDKIRRLFDYSLFVTQAGDLVSHLTNTVRTGGTSLDYCVEDFSLSSGTPPGFRDSAYKRDPDAIVYPDSEKARDGVLEKLTDWQQASQPYHFQKALTVLAQVSKEFLDCEEHFVHFEPLPGSTGTQADYRQTVLDHESVKLSDDQSDAVLEAKSTGENQPVACWVQRHRDGSVFIGNELGAGIRLVGNSVFIEGATIRLAASKDTVLIGRDVQLLTSRNISLQAQRHLRLYSNQNLHCVSGLSGQGGTLLECRSSNREVSLPRDPEKAIYSGITIRASRSQAIVQGGDVVLDAGVRGNGTVVVRAPASSVLISARNQVVSLSSGHTMLFGDEKKLISGAVQPDQAYLFGRRMLRMPGNLEAGTGWFRNRLYSRGTIMSVYGNVADMDGGRVNKVQDPSFFDAALMSFYQQAVARVQSLKTTVDKLNTRLYGTDQILSDQVRQRLSGGFVLADRATKHYGTGSLQACLHQLFQKPASTLAGGIKSLRVNYEVTGSGQPATYGWPGNTSQITVKVASPAPSIYTATRRLFVSSPGDELQIKNKPFSSVFRTVGDNEDDDDQQTGSG